MASSGWQNEQKVVDRSPGYYNGNIRIDLISHSGTNLHVKGSIAFCPRGGVSTYAYYYEDITVTPRGGSAKTIVPGYERIDKDKYADFDVTLTGISASSTSTNFTVVFYNHSYFNKTLSWTLHFDASGNPPSGYSVSNIVPEWDRVTFTSIVGSPNGTLEAHCPSIQKEPLVGGRQKYENTYNTGTISSTITSTVSNSSNPINNPTWTIQGCGTYYTGAYAKNNVSSTALYGQGDIVFTPPSPPTISYTDVITEGTRTYPVIFTNDPNKNNTDYDVDNLTRYLRYKINDGDWVVVVNNETARIDAISRFNLTLRPGAVATIEGYMTYQGSKSVTTQITITNDSPVDTGILYGSVNSLSKKLNPLYATLGNYFDPRKKILRDGYVETSLLGNSITARKTSSGSGTYHWIAYPIEETDELINKKVILEGSLKTGGAYTSGIRLWWLNSNNTGILSGPVASVEYIGNSGKFSATGTIPSRPSGAGKLALLLYSNISSASQGAFTVFDNINLKADTRNMFNYLGVKSSVAGLTPSESTDGTITVTGILTSGYQHITSTDRNITDLLEDGVKYTISAANTYTPDLAIEIRAKKTGESTYSYWNTRGQQSSTFTVNKTTYEKYDVYAITSTTASWGTESKTVSNKFQLEKGDSATTFTPFVDTKTKTLKKVYAAVNGRSKLIYDKDL